MTKKAKDFGNVVYPPSVINTGREYIETTFTQGDINIKITCHVLEQGITDCNEIRHFVHPAPPFSRLFIFLEGGAEVIIAAKNVQLIPGVIYLLPPDQPFEITYEISRLLFLHLHICDAAGQALFKGLKGIPAIDAPELFARFRQGFAESNKIQIFSAITEAIGVFLKNRIGAIAENARRNRGFALLFSYLENKPLAGITINELSDLYSISPDALSKRFRRTMGIPLKRYLLERQFNQAKELLLYSNMTVSQIASLLGHTNSQYFHRLFKKYCLCTPDEYRRKITRH
ncbi:MAG: AraC family transcriptional regulator [Victivallales bacterium]|nr:AraC family transcriptional regulator [Victivallales bacterium]